MWNIKSAAQIHESLAFSNLKWADPPIVHSIIPTFSIEGGSITAAVSKYRKTMHQTTQSEV